MEYLDQRMEPVLKETYGIMVYQEQVMRVAQVVGGYSLGGADLLRRAMGKKNVEEMKRQRAVFVKGAAERNVKESVATEIFDLMEKFAGYGFNKSHAAAYSYVAYQTAYLKVHHTSSFYAANLCMVMDDGDKMNALVTDAKNNGINFLIADINQSDWFFSVPNEAQIRFGLGAIKGINRSVVESIIRSRKEEGPYSDIFNFSKRVPEINQKIFESLIKAGAFDSIDRRRNVLLANVSDAIQYSRGLQDHLGQDALFGEEVATPLLKEYSTLESKDLEWEKNVYGFWVSSHPFEKFRKLFQNSQNKKRLLDLIPSKEVVSISGIVVDIRQVVGKKGGFGIVKIDDGTAILDLLIYSNLWDQQKYKIESGCFLNLRGRVKFDDYTKQLSFIVDEINDFYEYISKSFTKMLIPANVVIENKCKVKLLIDGSSSQSGVTVCAYCRNQEKGICGEVSLGKLSGKVRDFSYLKEETFFK